MTTAIFHFVVLLSLCIKQINPNNWEPEYLWIFLAFTFVPSEFLKLIFEICPFLKTELGPWFKFYLGYKFIRWPKASLVPHSSREQVAVMQWTVESGSCVHLSAPPSIISRLLCRGCITPCLFCCKLWGQEYLPPLMWRQFSCLWTFYWKCFTTFKIAWLAVYIGACCILFQGLTRQHGMYVWTPIMYVKCFGYSQWFSGVLEVLLLK